MAQGYDGFHASLVAAHGGRAIVEQSPAAMPVTMGQSCQIRKLACYATLIDAGSVSADQIPDPGPRVGLRERKKLATRHALGMAALRLAVERGLDNVLVEEIADRAGVSPRTFNNYFASKYEAICALAVDRARRMGDALRERPAGEPLWEAITHAVVGQITGTGEPPDRDWLAGVRLVTGSPALFGEFLKASAAMRDSLAEAIAERTGTDVRRDMYPRVVAGAVTAAFDVALDHWLRADPPTVVGPLVRRALRHLTEIQEDR
jgi:AcrR family transcriptional regulator